jgi:hypothetical protein
LAGATIDHLVSVTIFLAALLLFIGLFNQTIQTAVIYQQHNALATKCSDLLDTTLLTPNDAAVDDWTFFGLQDPGFSQYVLNPFSLMRLESPIGTSVYYEKQGVTYSNMTVGSGSSLFMPVSKVVDYSSALENHSSALEMLRIEGSYGFQLALTPTVDVSITEDSRNPYLTLNLSVSGVSFPLANAAVNYRLIPVALNGAYPDYLAISNQTGKVYTDEVGFRRLTFTDFTPDATHTYVFVAYAHVGGLAGVGFYAPASSASQQIIPLVESLSGTILLAHSADVPNTASSSESLAYNVAFVKLSNGDFEFQDNNSTGEVLSGADGAIVSLPVQIDAGVLVIAYQNEAAEGGVAVMPWGAGSLALPVTFGGDPAGQEWVATDMRQVLVSGIAYQAKLSLWSLAGVQVVG